MRWMILALAALAMACSPPATTSTATSDASMPGMATTTSVSAPITATGEVVGVDLQMHTVTIRHGAIAAIGWPAMVMAFQAEPSSLLYGIAVGDHVEFTLKSAAETGIIVGLHKQ